MSVIAKERLRGLKDNTQRLKGEIGNIEYKIELQKDRIQELENQSDKNIKGLEEKIESHKETLSELQHELIDLIQEEEDLLGQVKLLMQSNPDKKQESSMPLSSNLRTRLRD